MEIKKRKRTITEVKKKKKKILGAVFENFFYICHRFVVKVEWLNECGCIPIFLRPMFLSQYKMWYR